MGTYYTMDQASKKLGISRRTLESWVAKSSITFSRFGKKFIRFTDEDLEAVIDKSGRPLTRAY